MLNISRMELIITEIGENLYAYLQSLVGQPNDGITHEKAVNDVKEMMREYTYTRELRNIHVESFQPAMSNFDDAGRFAMDCMLEFYNGCRYSFRSVIHPGGHIDVIATALGTYHGVNPKSFAEALGEAEAISKTEDFLHRVKDLGYGPYLVQTPAERAVIHITIDAQKFDEMPNELANSLGYKC